MLASAIDPAAHAGPAHIVGPAGSHDFGHRVLTLENGNFVVVDAGFSTPTAKAVGAVYLYDGASNELISTLTGSQRDDLVGIEGVVEVGSSNFVVVSDRWDRNDEIDAGAVTWVDGRLGLDGVVSLTNSLVGARAGDRIGAGKQVPMDVGQVPPPGGVTVLTNGNYVVGSPQWHDGSLTDVGAVTWGSGDSALVGTVSATNSLVGSRAADEIGLDVTPLVNGNYVVSDSSSWRVADDFGSATLGQGLGGTSGRIDASNSLMIVEHTTTIDPVVVPLTNGNYVVQSKQSNFGGSFDDVVGAFTFGNGTTGVVGELDSTNSLIGSSPGDGSGSSVVALSNGNYAMSFPGWDSGTSPDVGAVIWGDGTAGTVGTIDPSSSITGSAPHALVGLDLTPLSNGNFVIRSVSAAGAPVGAGAITWVAGSGPVAGSVTVGNSLSGAAQGDLLQDPLDRFSVTTVVALASGDYVALSPEWNGDGRNRGAATWAPGDRTSAGIVGPTNSLVGSTDDDRIGESVLEVSGGYVVSSSHWAHGATDVGAATWQRSGRPVVGEISELNSMIGSKAGDRLSVTALATGDFFVVSSDGARWVNGFTGAVGVSTTDNSFRTPGSSPEVHPWVASLSDGNALIANSGWIGDTDDQRGSLTWVRGDLPVTGEPSVLNSVIGTARNHSLSGTRVIPFADGSYAVHFVSWDDGLEHDAGRVDFFGPGTQSGETELASTVVGDRMNVGLHIKIAERLTSGGKLVVGSALLNEVVLLSAQRGSGSAPHDTTTTTTTTTTSPTSSSESPEPTTTTVRATTTSAFSAPTTSSSEPVNAPPSFVPSPPVRIADTRPGEHTADGLLEGGGELLPMRPLRVQVAGRAGVAIGTSAVSLTLTAVGAEADGYVSTYPCTTTPPLVSNLNVVPGAIVSNAAIVSLDETGSLCILASVRTNIIVDVSGTFANDETYRPVLPRRVLDSRLSLSSGPPQRISRNSTVHVRIPNLSADTIAVALNVTAIDADDAGFLTIYDCRRPRPLASTLNYAGSDIVANFAIAPVSPNGETCIVSSTSVDLVVDLSGTFSSGQSFAVAEPSRVIDTRSDGQTADGRISGGGAGSQGGVMVVPVAGRVGLPSDLTAVSLNITAIGDVAPGFVTAYPCDSATPLATNVSVSPGGIVAVAAIVDVDGDGSICIFTSQRTHVVVDVTGWFA